MRTITVDFETYWDDTYSLSKMTTEEYVRDTRFQVLCVAIKDGEQPTQCYPAPQIADALSRIDWSNVFVVCHNTIFDGAILAWRYGIRPKLWIDTMSMARPKHAMTVGSSLKALAAHYGLGAKGDAVMRTQGMRFLDFSPAQLNDLMRYCVQDADLTYALLQHLIKGFPPRELRVIDQTVRMFVEPRFAVDAGVLEEHMVRIRERKKELYDRLGGEERARSVLMSNPKFAALLQALGVEPPTKLSPTTGKKTFAFAKTDPGLKALAEHTSPAVRAVVEARLGTKSTLEETRAERLIKTGQRGLLPVHLHYYGAHTGRFSGGSKLNLQNLPRGGALRKALTAPDGYVVVACDSSQIEARLVAYLAGQEDLVEAFAEGRDVYCEFATDVYQRPITKEHKIQRFVGKTCILGLGYSMSAERFRQTLTNGATPVRLDEDEAAKIVRLYRNKYHRIVAFWRAMSNALGPMSNAQAGMVNAHIRYDADGIILPNGLRIRYPLLRQRARGYEYINDARMYRRAMAGDPDTTWTKIYGGKCVENITQAFARIVISEQMAAIGKRYPVVLQVHDEIVCIAPEEQGEACKAYMTQVMSTPPEWAPDLPVACEAAIGHTYGDAK